MPNVLNLFFCNFLCGIIKRLYICGEKLNAMKKLLFVAGMLLMTVLPLCAQEMSDSVLFSVAREYNDQGLEADTKRDYAKALECYGMALTTLEKMKDDHSEIVAKVLCNIGVAYLNMGQAEKAVDSFQKSMAEIGNAPERDALMLSCYLNLGDAYNGLGRYAEAQDCFNKVLEVGSQAGADDYIVGGAQVGIGVSHFMQGDYAKAVEWLNKGLELVEKTGRCDKYMLANEYNMLGSGYLFLDDMANGYTFMAKAKDLMEICGRQESPVMLEIYNNLCVVYSKNGDNEHLLEYAEKGYNLSRKLNGDKHDATKWWKQLLKQAKHS